MTQAPPDITQVPPRHCGHCGAALAPGVAFCGSCGSPVAGGAAAVTPPPPPPVFATAAAVPRTKLRHGHTILIAGGVIAALVVVVTLVAVRVGGTSAHCGFYCGPHPGVRLSDPASFTNTKWGFVVDYSGSNLKLQKSDPGGDTADFLDATASGQQFGEITVTATSHTSTQAAIKSALDLYAGGQFTDIRPAGAVPGAEIGLIPGDGEGYTATLASSSGSTGSRVGIQIMAITHGNETIVASMWSPAKDDPGLAPFYLIAGQDFDFVLTYLHFTGG
jgi:hypothetical protein